MPDIVPVKRGTPVMKRESHGQEPASGSWPQPHARDWLSAPFREFDELWDRMTSRFFATAPYSGRWPRIWDPPIDIEETSDAWIFELELPGVDREDIQVEMTDAELSISGETRERERVGVLRHRTRRTGNFHYRTTLPGGVDPDLVEARLDNGVLTVRVPRPENAKARRIKIQ
jgi:HSP20 family protein